MYSWVRRRLSHLHVLLREKLWGLWLGALWSSLAAYDLIKGEIWEPQNPDKYGIREMTPHLQLAWWIVGLVAILAIWMFEASFRVTSHLEKKIVELGKVDRWDLQNMLGGMFYGDTYLFPVGFVLCKQYSGKFEVGSLKNGYDPVPVRAPRNSVVTIEFQPQNFGNNHNLYRFYIRDGGGYEKPIDDIYSQQNVLLGGNATFGLKLVTDNDFELDEHVSLLVTVSAWTK